MRVKVIGEVIPASFLKIEGDTRWGERLKKEGWLAELVGDQKPGPKYLPGAREGIKGDVRRGANARGAMEKNKYIRIIEGEEVGADDPIEYILPTWVGSTF